MRFGWTKTDMRPAAFRNFKGSQMRADVFVHSGFGESPLPFDGALGYTERFRDFDIR